MKLRVLDLFSGIGGFSLGLERTGGFETVAFCEIEEFPRKVLRKHWPGVPIYEDVRKLRGADVGHADVIVGGYPCQPFSTAGPRRGAEDDRHLWPEFSRLVAELRPTWVIGENVAGHISMGLDDVLSDLEGQGYACRTFVIPACAVGAPHRRDRCWTVAYADRQGQPSVTARKGENSAYVGYPHGQRRETLRGERENFASESLERRAQRNRSGGNAERQVSDGSAGEDTGNVAHSVGSGQPRQRQPVITSDCAPESQGQTDHAVAVRQPRKWSLEPNVGRVAHGVPGRMDRLKALGNAVVPQIPEMIGHAILAAEAAE